MGAAAAVASVLLLTLAASRVGNLLNGAPFYMPTLLMLVVATIAHPKQEQSRTSMYWATAAFAIALVFRSMDDAVCPNFRIGTHFLWHVLNAVAMFFGTKALMERSARTRSAAVRA